MFHSLILRDPCEVQLSMVDLEMCQSLSLNDVKDQVVASMTDSGSLSRERPILS